MKDSLKWIIWCEVFWKISMKISQKKKNIMKKKKKTFLYWNRQKILNELIQMLKHASF